MKLAGVSAGSPAEAAGFQAKDVLVKLNGAVIDNIYDFTNALGACRPGQTIEVVVKRGDDDVHENRSRSGGVEDYGRETPELN